MLRCIATLPIVLLLIAPVSAADEWIEIFNGRDLTGWTPKIAGHEAGENFADTFRVQDGKICVSFDKYEGDYNDRFGHLFYDGPLSNYILELEYRFVGEQAQNGPEWALRNSGVMIHGQTPESMGKGQFFPVSIEVQFLGGDGTNPRTTGNLCTPGTHVVKDGKLYTPHILNSSSDTYHGDQWVKAEIEVHGGELIRHKINGKTVLEYSRPQLDEGDADAKKLLDAGAEKMVTGGTISLQAESHPVEFRNIRLKKLDGEPARAPTRSVGRGGE
jgi:hypothetical protein